MVNFAKKIRGDSILIALAESFTLSNDKMLTVIADVAVFNPTVITSQESIF